MPAALPLHDIQGIILRGYGQFRSACFILFRVENGKSALAWLKSLSLTSAEAAAKERKTAPPFLNLAFTHAGLRALSTDPCLVDAFPRDYVEGPDTPERARILGDLGASASSQWQWGTGEREPHVMLLLYAPGADLLNQYRADFLRAASAAGLREITTLATNYLEGQLNHFGFRDGIAQPVVDGSRDQAPTPNTIAAGEILLGRENAFGVATYAPAAGDGSSFGNDGSYLVVRTFVHDVLGFWRDCRDHSADLAPPADAITLASKMVGRWPSGASLVLHPDGDPGESRYEKEDRFGFAKVDAEGARCPFGAHIRRVNPRDWLLAGNETDSITIANRHRIIRRGRSFGSPVTDPFDAHAVLQLLDGPEPPGERGLHFLCCQGNIERQFEFIQQQWSNDPNFAGLHGEPDPVAGSHQTLDKAGALFTVPGSPVRRQVQGLDRYNTIRGSAYFFIPSISAMRSLR